LLKDTYESIYRIELMTEVALSDNAMIATPHEYIVIDLDAQYEAEYEDWVDYKSYNASYGVD